MLADKTRFVANRTSPVPLFGRAMIGSLTGAAYAASRRHSVLLPAVAGAASAIATTFAAFHLRRLAAETWGIPDRLLGAVEDALIVAASRGIAEVMERR
jgi:uncharacterized membrane protein